MSEESKAGSVEADATVIIDNDGEPEAVVVELPESGETDDESNSDVAIAEIEANRDITIAAIEAETAQTAIEAETAKEDELSWEKQQINELTRQTESLKTMVSQLQEKVDLLTPPQLVEPEILETAIAATITPETETETSLEIETEARDENEDGNPEAESLTIRKKRRAI